MGEILTILWFMNVEHFNVGVKCIMTGGPIIGYSLKS